MGLLRSGLLAILATLLFAGVARAADPGPVPPAFAATGRPRIGLVLGGGGAKGFAHIGVIAELERRHIPVDVISGTSMGAVVGSMYAIGNDAGQIKAIADGIDWVTIFNDRPNRGDLSFRRKREVRDVLLNYRLGVEDGKPVLPRGALGGQRLFATIQELLAPWRATEDFNNLPIPFRAVATDIVTGQPVEMGSGNLSTAVFASMAIPAAFPPVKREGLLLVDGGISDNLPVDVARRMGVDTVIVVDVGEPPHAADEITNAINVVNQMQLLLGYDAVRRQRASLSGRDVLVEPDITGLSVAAFDQMDLAFERGRQAAAKMADRLAPLAVGDAEWAAYLAARRARARPAPIRIDRVVVATDSKVPAEDIRVLVRTQPGDILDGTRMKQDVASIYKLDEFDRVDYRVDTVEGANTLVLNAERARGGRRYFQTGLILASNFGKSATFEIGLGYTDRDFLRTGAEWRGFARVGNDVLLETSLYKQWGRLFVEPIANYQRYSSLITQQGSQPGTAALQVSRIGAGVDGGLLFGNWGELRGGVRFGGLNPGDEAATLGIESGWSTDVDWRAGFTVDTLDALTFPRSGLFAQVQYIDHVTALGGRFTRNNVSLVVQKPFSRDRTTVVLGARLATTTSGSGDFIGDFQLGGFLNLSGLQRNSLIGQQLLFGRAVAYHRLSERAPILDLPVYLGGSLEVGNVWTERDDISLGSLRTAASAFVAADTPIGPFWLAYGLSGGNGSIYLVLGRVF